MPETGSSTPATSAEADTSERLKLRLPPRSGLILSH
jgi:hypothetical protein